MGIIGRSASRGGAVDPRLLAGYNPVSAPGGIDGLLASMGMDQRQIAQGNPQALAVLDMGQNAIMRPGSVDLYRGGNASSAPSPSALTRPTPEVTGGSGGTMGGLDMAPAERPASTGAGPTGIFGNMARRSSPGLSMIDAGRAAVDYTSPAKREGRGFFRKDGPWKDVLGVALDTLAMSAGGRPMYMIGKQRQHDEQLWQQRHDLARREQLEDWQREQNAPRYFSGDQQRYNPGTGQVETIYQKPLDAQRYAADFGAPGSDEYKQAAQDFVLRSWGSTAMGNRYAQDEWRQQGREDLEEQRQGNRLELRTTPTYSNLHPRPPAPRRAQSPTPTSVIGGIMADIAAGRPITPEQRQMVDNYRAPRNGRRTPQGRMPEVDPDEGRIIKNPKTGKRMIRREGEWVNL